MLEGHSGLACFEARVSLSTLAPGATLVEQTPAAILSEPLGIFSFLFEYNEKLK